MQLEVQGALLCFQSGPVAVSPLHRGMDILLFQRLKNSVNVGKLLNVLSWDLKSRFVNQSLGYVKASLPEEVVTHGLVQQHGFGSTELLRGSGSIVCFEVLRKDRSKALAKVVHTRAL